MIEILMTLAMASASPSIEAHLKLHPDTQVLDDEWAGVTDPLLRRKLQNRLNQRATRRRKAANGRCDRLADIRCVPERPMQTLDLGNLMSVVAGRAKAVEKRVQPIGGLHDSNDIAFRSIRETRVYQIQTLYKRITAERDSRASYPLPADHLLSLVYYNVYRALVANVALLGLSLDLFSTESYPSPFTPCSPTATSALKALPPALQPTELQQSIAHHPQWDIVPVPKCRDNLLRRGQNVDINDVELCLDLIGSEERRQRAGKKQEPPGCIVWGDPWDLKSWEVTDCFVRRYPWLFTGTADLEASTNAHRRKRDEKPLRFVELGVPEM